MKKIFIILFILTIFAGCASVYAEENVTEDIIDVSDIPTKNSTDNLNSVGENDEIVSSNEYISESPPRSAYWVTVPDTNTINHGSEGSIVMTISPASDDYYYKYDFYLKIYDSKNVEKISQRYCSHAISYAKIFNIGGNDLNPGTYEIDIINNFDKETMYVSKLTIKSVPASEYSVAVSDTTINYGDNGFIVMNITGAPYSYPYRYDYYLKIYNSNNVEKLSQRYYSATSSRSQTYNIGANFPPGTYKVKIINCEDNREMSAVTLTIKSAPTSENSNNNINNINNIQVNSVTVNVQKTSTTIINKSILIIKPVKIKKSAKKLVLQATLKKGKSLLINKKITFKFNGKTYKAKTNKKGIAKIIIKKSVLKKLKVGKKVKYQANYGNAIAKKNCKSKKVIASAFA